MELNVKAKPQPKAPLTKVDPYAALKKAYAEGKKIQWYDEEQERWVVLLMPPSWTSPVSSYRVQADEPQPDPLAAIKQAHANGAVVEMLSGSGEWIRKNAYTWSLPPNRYRIKGGEPGKDAYAEFKKAQAEGKVVQFFDSVHGRWTDAKIPLMFTRTPDKYRIKPDVVVENHELALYTNITKKLWWIGHKNEQGTWEKLVNVTITNGVPTAIAFKE